MLPAIRPQCRDCALLLQGRDELPRRHSCRTGFDMATAQDYHAVTWRIQNAGTLTVVVENQSWIIKDNRVRRDGRRSLGTVFFYEHWRALNALTQMLAEWYELE